MVKCFLFHYFHLLSPNERMSYLTCWEAIQCGQTGSGRCDPPETAPKINLKSTLLSEQVLFFSLFLHKERNVWRWVYHNLADVVCPVHFDEPSVLGPGGDSVGMWQVVQVLAELIAEGWFAWHAVAAGTMQTDLGKSVFKLGHAGKFTCNGGRSHCEDWKKSGPHGSSV